MFHPAALPLRLMQCFYYIYLDHGVTKAMLVLPLVFIVSWFQIIQALQTTSTAVTFYSGPETLNIEGNKMIIQPAIDCNLLTQLHKHIKN